MATTEMKQQWAVNDLCKVIVGFRNFTTHVTRSRYVSFAIAEQPQMCELLVRLAQAKLGSDQVARYPSHLFEQLIDLGFLQPLARLDLRARWKRWFSVLNSGRFASVCFRGQHYHVASYVFMAFYSQRGDDFLRETVVLPAWSRKFTAKVFDIVRQGANTRQFEALPASLQRRLVKHGLLSPPDKLPYFERFFQQHCQLSGELIDELPEFYRRKLPPIGPAENYLLNDGVYLSIDAAGADLRAQIPNLQWALSCKPSVWVRDPVKGIVSMYWLTPSQMDALAGLTARTKRIAELDNETLRLFVYSGILHDPSRTEAAREQWTQRLQALSGQLAENACFTFESILSPIELAIGRKYLRFMMDKKFLLLDRANGSTQQRFWRHRDEFTFYLQGQVCALINQVLPEPVKPGHNALTIYQSGATLPRHKDDVLAFSWVMSLPVETQPEISKDQAWPIYVETPSAVHKAMLQSGDGHLINPQMPHWREVLEEGKLNILFLWFVPKDFKGFVNGSWID